MFTCTFATNRLATNRPDLPLSPYPRPPVPPAHPTTTPPLQPYSLKRPLLPTRQAGWLRLNMGAIHFAQQDYAQAVKQFRMALDQTPPAYQRLRFNTMRNIGLAFVRSGRYREAADTFAAIMQDGPDHQSAFNLVLCAAALGDPNLMRQSFVQLVQASLLGHGGDARAGAGADSPSSSRDACQRDAFHLPSPCTHSASDSAGASVC